ncbi:uncharacterized protein [Nicotiana tomentosiformis]|uniref:uncharacterized protein n=1 Tax=Nicotiana tomentosiformis TaxID=4098 RepID=UPI00051B36BF|nr:craniofacial development protein 2-like [Nicotiana tomentosiformis]
MVVGGSTLNIISAYVPQAGMDEEVKRHFWEDLDGLVNGIPHSEKLIIRGNFNDHIGTTSRDYDGVHAGFDFGDKNEGGTSKFQCAKAFDFVIANSCFSKNEEHLVTFQNTVAKIQIDYVLFRKYDRGLCTDCTVIPSEDLTTQHRLLVMDLEIIRKRKKRDVYGQPRIRRGALTKDKAQHTGEKLPAIGPGGVVET